MNMKICVMCIEFCFGQLTRHTLQITYSVASYHIMKTWFASSFIMRMAKEFSVSLKDATNHIGTIPQSTVEITRSWTTTRTLFPAMSPYSFG